MKEGATKLVTVNAQALAQMGGYTMAEMLSLTVSDICPDMPPEQFAEGGGAMPPAGGAPQRRRDQCHRPCAL